MYLSVNCGEIPPNNLIVENKTSEKILQEVISRNRSTGGKKNAVVLENLGSEFDKGWETNSEIFKSDDIINQSRRPKIKRGPRMWNTREEEGEEGKVEENKEKKNTEKKKEMRNKKKKKEK
ncbi:hypothetical protein QE152_g27080 [Popillia japonica]|uniref:Uncharacterized protein n=1 Tax=Popillia japonica TaxID=7064 RepID=A0AAW1JWL4_POPJA